MNRIESNLSKARAAKHAAIMPFICGGHPTPQATRSTLAALQRAGASVVEIGIPFSDPIADGPVIAEAMHQTLTVGVTPNDVLSAVSAARGDGVSLGIVAMVSVSIVHRLGAENLARRAAEAGIDGFIFPDAPIEESDAITAPARALGLSVSHLIAPTTPADRAARIAERCTGFVYLLARVGITGETAESAGLDVEALRGRVRGLRGATDLPIACGFGISNADQVRLVTSPPEAGGAGADAAIVGSALVKRMARASAQGRDAALEAEAFIRAIAIGVES